MEYEELQENSLIGVFVQDVPVLFAKKEGKIYALYDRCAHMECLLSNGSLEGYLLRCPCHYWRYDIRTGEFLDAKEIVLPTFECKVLDGNVFIDMGEAGQ